MYGWVFLLILVLGLRHSAFVLASHFFSYGAWASWYDLDRIVCGTAVRRDRTTYLGCEIGILNFILNVTAFLKFNVYASEMKEMSRSIDNAFISVVLVLYSYGLLVSLVLIPLLF